MNDVSQYSRSRTYNARIRKAALDILGGKCVRCGFSDERALQIDHIYGGGHQERLTTKKSVNLLVIESVEKGEERYQILCANCNWIKRCERGEIKPTN